MEVSRLLDDGSIHLRGYPPHMVDAEKLVTALARGIIDTRWRDFADVYLLIRRYDQDARHLRSALEAVGRYRQVPLELLAGALDGYAAQAQTRWAIWRRKQQLEDRLPEQFSEVLDAILRFADLVLTSPDFAATWRADALGWH